MLHDNIHYWHGGAAVLSKLLHVAHILEAANQREPWVCLCPNELVIGHALCIPYKKEGKHSEAPGRSPHA